VLAGKRLSTRRSARGVRERAVTDPEPKLAVPRLVAARRGKPVIGNERAIETETTLAISWSGPGLSRFVPRTVPESDSSPAIP